MGDPLDWIMVPVPKTGFGLPFWIAVVVLDPKAPSGVAYAPDTYVIRI